MRSKSDTVTSSARTEDVNKMADLRVCLRMVDNGRGRVSSLGLYRIEYNGDGDSLKITRFAK